MKYFSGQEPGTILKQKTCPTKGVLGQKEIVFRNLFHHPNLRQKGGEKQLVFKGKCICHPAALAQATQWSPGRCWGAQGSPGPGRAAADADSAALTWGAAIFQCVQRIPLPKRTSQGTTDGRPRVPQPAGAAAEMPRNGVSYWGSSVPAHPAGAAPCDPPRR